MTTLEIEKSLIFADQLKPSGYTYTLVTRVCELLEKIEDEFGPPSTNYIFLGVEFSHNGPQTWYPQSQVANYVAIQLSDSARTDEKQALFQLAHECVHLLDPTGVPDSANVLEEGAAVYMQHKYTTDLFGSSLNTSVKYDASYKLVNELIGIEPNVIMNLRNNVGSFGAVTETDILTIAPSYSSKKASTLCSKFSTYNPS